MTQKFAYQDDEYLQMVEDFALTAALKVGMFYCNH